MQTHTPVEDIVKHKADFRVKYRFYSKEEGGRTTIPHQGYRPDFWYDHEGTGYPTQLFMIWPEFEDSNGDVIPQKDSSVNPSGTARMWIITPEYRNYHIGKVHIGLKCFMMEASRKVAECEVIEILDLEINPRE